MKWNMGWMHDMLDYFSKEPVFRRFHQNDITFSMLYAFTENFLLPISHDEVVHGKGALISKMPGDEWQRFANVRAFLGYMFCHPGKKLLFMGSEFGQTSEWNHDESLPWWLLQFPVHQKLQTMVREVNHLYRREPALHQVDDDYRGFEWIDFRDAEVERDLFRALRAGSRELCGGLLQLHAGAAVGLPDRPSAPLRVSGDFQQRRGDVRRQQPG